YKKMKEEIKVNQDELESSSEDDDSDLESENSEEEISEGEDVDDEEEDDDEDDEEEADNDDDSKGEENEMGNIKSQKTKSGGKHIVFDDDEDFENLPVPNSLASGPGPGLEDLEDTDEDSDDAPDEVVNTAALEAAIKQDKKLKEENKKAKLSIKDARKKTHERNKEQKEEKHQRLKALESERLPEDLLAAVLVEQAQQQSKRKVAIQKHKGKIKKFKNNNDESETESQRGVQVRAVIKEMKKYSTIMAKAADFREQKIYGSDVPRRSSKDARMLKEKLRKSGKDRLVK
ncbi:unnamed protein product, partial [Meganyctiphanes norvegica]